MAYDPDRHHRRSVRLKGYDYTRDGAYFVTLCTHAKSCHFGSISDGRMRLNEAGSMVDHAWARLPEIYPGVALDEFVTMPNHLHGIIVLGDRSSAQATDGVRLSLGEVIKRFKTWTGSRYNKGVREAGWPPFQARLWQRNYHDRIIRDELELERIRHYIHHNPLDWRDDDYHPAKTRQRQGPVDAEGC